MIASDWIRAATTLTQDAINNGKVSTYKKELTFFKSVFPSVVGRMTKRSPHVIDSIFRISIQSFSIAHQQAKDLTGVINVVLRKSDGCFRDTLDGYLAYMERDVSIYTAAYLAAKKVESWETKGSEQPPMSSQYVIVTDMDVVMEDYRSLLATTQMTDKVNTSKCALILISQRPLDEYPSVRATTKEDRIDFTRFKADILDPHGIYKELRHGHT